MSNDREIAIPKLKYRFATVNSLVAMLYLLGAERERERWACFVIRLLAG
jgi:hypothetical protein